ncbi:MAG: hypothetical protein CW338_05020, partial [Clostridiales bacterium]|nr:hypothetical protein [Clostridiales bacterium]
NLLQGSSINLEIKRLGIHVCLNTKVTKITPEGVTGEWKDGAWTDRHILKKKTLKEESAAPGKTIGMILSRAYFGQEEITSSGRRPAAVRLCDRPCSHYAFSFGARAYDISDEFGVTFSYSDIDDERAGWRLRNVFTGSQVEPPEMG